MVPRGNNRKFHPRCAIRYPLKMLSIWVLHCSVASKFIIALIPSSDPLAGSIGDAEPNIIDNFKEADRVRFLYAFLGGCCVGLGSTLWYGIFPVIPFCFCI